MSDAPRCPVCTQQIGETKSLVVCASCHDSLQPGANVSVSVTGEFPVMSQLAFAADAEQAAPASAPQQTGSAGAVCTWCSKPGGDVLKMLTHGTSSICNECVALCSRILDSEFGETWRER
jgi:3-hydroxy-3-methylglutaryl CoA synthase